MWGVEENHGKPWDEKPVFRGQIHGFLNTKQVMVFGGQLKSKHEDLNEAYECKNST